MRLNNKKWRAHNKGLILLISDCPKINAAITANLSCNGYEVRIFKDPLSVFNKLSAIQVHLIIMRAGMPAMDELEMIINIRDLNVSCPIIVIQEKTGRCLPAFRADLYKKLRCYPLPFIELNTLKESGGLTLRGLTKKIEGLVK